MAWYPVTDTRFERVTFSNDALPLRQSVEGNTTRTPPRYVRGERERARRRGRLRREGWVRRRERGAERRLAAGGARRVALLGLAARRPCTGGLGVENASSERALGPAAAARAAICRLRKYC
jgi:hypothetical protein